jgi:hypothetical protein
MHIRKKNLQVTQQPNGESLQLTYELGPGRKIHVIPQKQQNTESEPHAAGSYHNPEQHAIYMERIDAMLTTPAGKPSSNASNTSS